MSAAPIRDLALAFRVPAEFSTPESAGRMHLDELEVLRLDVDMVAPPEAAQLAEPLVEQFQATPTSGDHLRLPQPPRHSAAQLRGAVDRILAADASTAARSPDAVVKEARMRRVLTALKGANQLIQQKSQLALAD
ncbi:MAG: hypothetical protein KC933_21650 [Myxococcales bacterium]|nr:hypothetical protein [Myxococcales bacterium]